MRRQTGGRPVATLLTTKPAIGGSSPDTAPGMVVVRSPPSDTKSAHRVVTVSVPEAPLSSVTETVIWPTVSLVTSMLTIVGLPDSSGCETGSPTHMSLVSMLADDWLAVNVTPAVTRSYVGPVTLSAPV